MKKGLDWEHIFLAIAIFMSFSLFTMTYFEPEQQIMPITGYQTYASTISRVIPNNVVAPGAYVDIQINVEITDTRYIYLIKETVTAGFSDVTFPQGSPANIIDDILKWAYIEQDGTGAVPAVSRTYHYRIKAPTTPGTYPVSGTYAFDGMSEPVEIAGDDEIIVQAPGECDDGETRDCTTVNQCDGTEACINQEWGGVCEPIGYFCDTDCDGDQECSLTQCSCSCTLGQNQTCVTTAHGCTGISFCTGGIFGSCQPVADYCDTDCDGTDECTNSTCPNCGCIGDINESCTTVNGCQGLKFCISGTWSGCQPTGFFCDTDCDGDQECSANPCAACPCTGTENQSCTTEDGCQGTQFCSGGSFGACQNNGYFCDSDCDGDEECVATACDSCSCTPDWRCTDYSDCVDGKKTRTCTDNNNCSTDAGKPDEEDNCRTTSGGGGDDPPVITNRTRCTENWQCTSWSACTISGVQTRTCTDANSCGTETSKPVLVNTCTYGGTCSDGVKNNDEDGVDCGGSCPNDCNRTRTTEAVFELSADPIVADIVSSYRLKVRVKNIGNAIAENLKLAVTKYTDKSHDIDVILAGDEAEYEFVLQLPAVDEGDIEIQLIKGSTVLKSLKLPLTLNMPSQGLKFLQNPDTGTYYPFVIFDNKDGQDRIMDIEYEINKNGRTYHVDVLHDVAINSGEVYQQPMSNKVTDLPSGDYDVIARFYEDGDLVAEEVSQLSVDNDKKALNIKWLFYLIILAMIGVFVYILYSEKR